MRMNAIRAPGRGRNLQRLPMPDQRIDGKLCRIVPQWRGMGAGRRGRQGRIEKGRTSELECCNVYLAMARTCTQSIIDITLF